MHVRPASKVLKFSYFFLFAEIEFAEEDKVVSAYTTPNDPDLPQQWALYEMGLFTDTPLDNGLVEQGAWNRTYGGDVIVCIIDSGVDWTHPGEFWNVVLALHKQVANVTSLLYRRQ